MTVPKREPTFAPVRFPSDRTPTAGISEALRDRQLSRLQRPLSASASPGGGRTRTLLAMRRDVVGGPDRKLVGAVCEFVEGLHEGGQHEMATEYAALVKAPFLAHVESEDGLRERVVQLIGRLNSGK